MYAIKRELKLNKKETSLMRGINCFYEIRRQFVYKQAHYGTKVELVDRWYASSKTCSQCGHVQDMKLTERVFNCQSCGHSQDRDANASINLENAPEHKVRLA